MSKNVTLEVISLMGEPSMGTLMNARVLDVSGSGMRLELSQPVPCGATVQIEDQRMRVVGETLRCDPAGAGYVVAVSVSETSLIDDPFATPRTSPPARS